MQSTVHNHCELLKTCFASGYVAETQWATHTNGAQSNPVAGAEPREVMPLVSYRVSAEAVLREIHEVAGSKCLAKQVLIILCTVGHTGL